MRIALVLAALVAPLIAAAAEPGAVDWQRKVVTCTGSGAANLRDAGGNPAVARIGAEKVAKLDALRNCMETLRGVQLESGKTVGGALASDAELSGRVQGLVRGFKIVGKPRYFSDGGVELDVEVPLTGALSDALLPRPGAEPAPVPPPPSGTAPAAPPPAAAPTGPAAAAPIPAPAAAEAPTSLVVDARGQKVLPALAPRLLDEAGKELYGPSRLGEAGRKAGGGAAYAPDLEIARKALATRVGERPMVVKAVRAQGADLVLGTADAAALAGKDLSFLADAKVVILAN